MAQTSVKHSSNGSTRKATNIKRIKPHRGELLLVSIFRAGAFVEEATACVMKQHDITNQQYNVLRILRGAGDDGLPCLEVARRMINRLPDITRLLDRIEKQGWIRRERSAEDRRVVKVYLTEGGLALLDEMQAPIRKLNQRVLGHLSNEQMDQLDELLGLVMTEAQKQDDPTGCGGKTDADADAD